MKNKSEKLARNAIRARKAKNKRANEQDKPKKGKRWLIRLGTLMGCLLLVSALVVPCFADAVYYPPYVATDDFYDAFLEYNVSDNVLENPVFMRTINAYRGGIAGHNDKELFYNHLLCFSSVDYTNVTRSLDANLLDGSGIRGSVLVEYITMNIVSRDDPSVNYLSQFDNGEFVIDIYSNGDDVQLVIDFNATWDALDYNFKFYAYDFTYVEGNDVNFEPDSYRYEVYESGVLQQSGYLGKIEVAYTVLDSFIGPFTIDSVSLLHSVLFVSNLYSYYHPLAFANGYFGGQLENGTYADGYNAGYSMGYDVGINEGYIIGHNDGYDAGYAAGEQASYDTGFTDGYNVGVNTTDSANLGKNLIGDTFSAPLEGLRQFVLIDWTTDDGRNISISLLSLLSAALGVMLVIWFIKLFAGG